VICWGDNSEAPYFWAFDSAGSNKLSETACDFIGLPRLDLKPYLLSNFWEDYHYSAMQQFQELSGFDPFTQDFARAHNMPLLEFVSTSEEIEKGSSGVPCSDNFGRSLSLRMIQKIYKKRLKIIKMSGMMLSVH